MSAGDLMLVPCSTLISDAALSMCRRWRSGIRPVYTDIEPVAVVPVANGEALRRALLDAIARKNADHRRAQWQIAGADPTEIRGRKILVRPLPAMLRTGASEITTGNIRSSAIERIPRIIGNKTPIRELNFRLVRRSTMWRAHDRDFARRRANLVHKPGLRSSLMSAHTVRRMASLPLAYVAGIRVFIGVRRSKDVDGRNKSGHDDVDA